MSENDKKDDSGKESTKKAASFKDSRSGQAKDYIDRSIKYFSMKYANTRMGQNFDTLQRYKKVYYHLIENELPILKGGERKKLAKRAE